ncbi:MAG: hypothetical protein AAGI52_09465 [Bacteroidota bacterium]
MLSRIASAFVALSRAYAEIRERRSALAVLVLLIAVFASGWLLATSASLLGLLVLYLPWLPDPEAKQVSAELTRMVISASLFVGVLVAAYARYGRYTPPADVNQKPPDSRRGLVVLLSRFGLGAPFWATLNSDESKTAGLTKDDLVRQLEAPVSLPDVAALLDADPPLPDDALVERLAPTNWGPLALAAYYHRSTLEHVYIISTAGSDGSHDSAPLATQLIRRIVGDPALPVKTERTVAVSASNAETMGDLVTEVVFRQCVAEDDLDHADVIVDFTGGTGAMTAGAILGARAEKAPLQYFQQHVPVLRSIDGYHRPRPAYEVLRDEAIVGITIETRRAHR